MILCLVVALATIRDLKLHSIDITAVFTKSDLDEDIYLLQPEEFHQNGPNMVLKLKKLLYGLKQSSHQ